MKRWLANKLIHLARWIDPPNPKYMEFIMDRMTEAAITGRSFVKITALDKDEVMQIKVPE